MEERCSVWRRADTAGTGAFTSGDVSQLDGVNNGCLFFYFFFMGGARLSPCLASKKKKNKESRKHVLKRRFSVVNFFGAWNTQKSNISFDELI